MDHQDKNDLTVITKKIGMETAGISITIAAVAILLSLTSFSGSDLNVVIGRGQHVHNILGIVGAHLADLLFYLFGMLAYEVAVLLGLAGIGITLGKDLRLFARDWLVLALHLFSLAVVIHAIAAPVRFMGHSPAGLAGRLPGKVLVSLFSVTGTIILGVSVALLSVFYVFRLSLVDLIKRMFAGMRNKGKDDDNILKYDDISDDKTMGTSTLATRPDRAEQTGTGSLDMGTVQELQVPATDVDESRPQTLPEPTGQSQDKRINEPEPQGPIIKERFVQPEDVHTVGSLEVESTDYELPPVSLLEYVPQKVNPMDEQTYKENAEKLEKKLKNYKVEGRVTEIHPGPVVTMYEFKLAPGIKISQVANLSDDLAMALHALSVRIVAPLPGKGVIGVEVPNLKRETVYLREILVSDVFRKSKGKLTMALGKDIEGKPVVTDLAKLPHLLISGATGSGKSVALNAMLLSILYKSTPKDVRIIMVDPKVVELQIFEGIPHLLLPVVYDAKHAAQALKWAVGEMERRYEMLAKYGVRNIDSFNKLVERANNGEDLPFNNHLDDNDIAELQHMSSIVIVVDEFADLMMVASKDVESSVARLAQKARAAGIHLIMATQRPSKDVVTGLIKANFPARISFRVSSKVDSRIVLDQNGAESLLGYGDMLFLKPGTSIVQRVHGAFTSEEDVKRVTNAWRAQGAPDYEMDILKSDDDDSGIDPKELDPLIEQGKQVIIESRRASISYLQRRLKIGYNRAARMMEQLEKLGVVGPPDHKGEREVLD